MRVMLGSVWGHADFDWGEHALGKFIRVRLPRIIVGKLAALVPTKPGPVRDTVVLGSPGDQKVVQFVLRCLYQQFRIEDNYLAQVAFPQLVISQLLPGGQRTT